MGAEAFLISLTGERSSVCATTETLTWLIVRQCAHDEGYDLFVHEMQRPTIVDCSFAVCMERAIGSAQHGYYEPNHTEYEGVDARCIVQRKAVSCGACLQHNVGGQ